MDQKTIEYIVFAVILVIPLILFLKRKHVPEKVVTPLDRCESPIEQRLYKVLVNNGYYVATQVPCGRYRIDLALPGDRIAIECDGEAYHSTPQQKAHDRRKNEYLRANGWKVLRFSGKRIYKDMRGILKRIEKEAKIT
ncbi:endonuclease domain-containing protein [Alkalihalobacterium alkalinitrilicum]|uniref:endonuclease domain-containing protein n=1 Tax=Alkalihalobacterium alkalinitrilicum TaxID=427920 RepID=UPI0009956425|nr:DUF559 domain-containing protein [Alkalihalobacterium alkalinitrilicum]